MEIDPENKEKRAEIEMLLKDRGTVFGRLQAALTHQMTQQKEQLKKKAESIAALVTRFVESVDDVLISIGTEIQGLYFLNFRIESLFSGFKEKIGDRVLKLKENFQRIQSAVDAKLDEAGNCVEPSALATSIQAVMSDLTVAKAVLQENLEAAKRVTESFTETAMESASTWKTEDIKQLLGHCDSSEAGISLLTL